MQLPKTNGGLRLPNLKYYFWATQINPLIVWIQNLSYTRWLNIEKSLCGRPLQIMPFIELPKGEANIGEWTRLTLNIWRKIKLAFGSPKAISALTNIGSISDFAPSQMDAGFKKWLEHGLIYLHQLLRDGSLKSFAQSREEFMLLNTDFF